MTFIKCGSLALVAGSMVFLTTMSSAQVLHEAEDIASPVTFEGHKVVRVLIENEQDRDLMEQLSNDQWSHRQGADGTVDYRVTPDAFEQLKNTDLAYSIYIDNLQTLIDREQNHLGTDTPAWFDDYKTLSEVSDYVDDLVALRPDLVTRTHVGTSIHGNEIFGMVITSPGGGDKPGVFFHGCQHAREWISVMVPMYIADRMIRDYDTDPAVQDILDRTEIHIIPIVNPDGYDYTWTNNRMWRKNRRGSHGVDLNRNWGWGWGGEGSSGNKWSEIYRGTGPFSEPETDALRQYIVDRPNLVTHIDIHSYSQLILQPWGNSSDLPPDHATFEEIGEGMKNAIFGVHGKTYEHGPTYTIIYPVSGGSNDWTYGDQGLLGFGFELRDLGQHGFILPANQIVPNGEEIFPAIMYLADFVSDDITEMVLSVDPLFAGQQLTAQAVGAEPAETVYLTYSTQGIGSRYIASLNVTLDLGNPKLATSATADGSGEAIFETMVPSDAPPITVWFQAAHFERTSNTVESIIN